jgi:hypothetical protein
MNERTSTMRAALTSILALTLAACTGSASGTKAGGSGGGGGGAGGSTGKDGGGLQIKQDAGAPPTGAGTPIKFCNALALEGNMNLRLILNIGEPAVKLTADSGGCSTMPGTACQTIPPGDHAVVVTDDAGEMIFSGMATIGAGEQWMVLATLDRMTMQPTLLGGALKAGYTCATIDPFMPPPGDAGAGN